MSIPPLRTDQLGFDEIRSLVGRDDPIILEIGANNGGDSRRFLDAFPRCQLFCFEPDSRAIDLWRKNVKDPRAILAPVAVGAFDGTLAFHVSSGPQSEPNRDWNRSGSIRAPKTHLTRWPTVTFPRTMEVTCTRLDTWLASQDIDRIDFIWADVQGAEGDVVAGATRALAMTRFFYTEYSNEEWYEGQIDLSTLVQLLPDFELTDRFPTDVLFRRRTSAKPGPSPSARREVCVSDLPAIDGEVVLRAIDATERTRVAFKPEFGGDVAVADGRKGETVCLLAWDFRARAGDYELWAQYAAAGTRPVAIDLNGNRLFSDALIDTTYGWTEAYQLWFFQGEMRLGDGLNRLSLSANVIPHIRELRLIPATGRALPDVLARKAAFQSSSRHLADEGLFDFVRAVAPVARRLAASGTAPDEIVEAFSHVVRAAAIDLANPQQRVGFKGPLNGQVIRQKLFTEIDRLLRFDVLLETGSYLGTSTEMLASYERPVFSCEINIDYYFRSAIRLAHLNNVILFRNDSRSFLRSFCAKYASSYKMPFFYLDAHWNKDLPLPEEISIIRDNFSGFTIMVDDFKHPKFQYGFDKYKSGIELTLEYLVPKLATTEGLWFLFPMHSQHAESGARRGTLVIAPDHIAERILNSGIPLMRHPV